MCFGFIKQRPHTVFIAVSCFMIVTFVPEHITNIVTITAMLKCREIFVKKARAVINATLCTDNSQKLQAAGRQQRSNDGGPNHIGQNNGFSHWSK